MSCIKRFNAVLAGGFAVKAIVIQLCAVLLVSASSLALDSEHATNPVLESASAINANPGEFAQSLNSYFIENEGQVSREVRFYSRGNPAVAFRDDGIMFVLSETRADLTGPPEALGIQTEHAANVRSVAYMVRFEGANDAIPVGGERLPFNVNFFIGNDTGKWKANVPTFGEVVYESLYDGIDLVYRQGTGGVKYELRVEPGADPAVISMHYEGVESTELAADGLVVNSALGELRDSIPYSYQENGGNVDCRFISRGIMSHGFDCGGWDRSKTLVIDPLVYSTYLTGSMSDGAYAVTASDLNRAYVTGYTQSPEFPDTPGAFDTDLDLDGFGYGYDAFVAEFNELGTLPFFITFLGGHNIDSGNGIALDPLRNVYVTGLTSSADFPTSPTAYSKTLGGSTDAFVTKLDPTGSFLNYSSYLGGSNPDSGTSIAVDDFGNATVTGYTYSINFPVTPSAWDKIGDGKDAFVTRFFWTAEWLVYSTYLGGTSMDTGNGVAIDSDGNAYITGETRSSDFPTTANATDLTFNGTRDGFLTKLNRAGSTLFYSTYLGGENADAGYSIAVDKFGGVYVAGETSSPDFNVTNAAYDTTYNGGSMDAFVIKFNMTAGIFDYSTFLGGPEADEARGIAVDEYGVAYVTGETNSSGFPTTTWAYDNHGCSGTWDVFVTKLKPTGDGLVYSSYLASADGDYAHSIALDPQNGFYVAGETNSSSFPTTPGAFSTVFGGRWDGFLAKFPSLSVGDPPDLMTTSGYITFNPSSNVPIGTLVVINTFVFNIGGTNASLVRVRFYDGTPSPTNQIGSDYIIANVEYFGGSNSAQMDWEALVVGFHNICVVVDPEKEIAEINENNNQACAGIRVFIPPSPDLVMTASNISFSPPAPVVEWTNVTINATIWNAGGGASGQTLAQFRDGGPTSGRIGPDQSVVALAPGGLTTVSMLWNTSGIGNHVICVIVDPDNVVAEANENNNLACVDYEVLAPGVFRADYLPSQPVPPSPARVALSSTLKLSIRVFNQGDARPASNATVAFYDQLSPNFPFAEFELRPLNVSDLSQPFNATWTSPATPCVRHLVADVDWRDNVTEWNEDNNLFVWTVNVVTGPVTSLVIGNPNYTSVAPATYVRSTTPLDFSVVDQSRTGIVNTTYRIDGGDWINYTEKGHFHLLSEGDHSIDWYSIDRAGNVEEVASMTLKVDDTPPVTAISVGEPKHVSGGTYVNSSTPLNLSATDSGVGFNSTFYRLWGGSWSSWSGFTVSFSINGRDGIWFVEAISYDYLGNKENVENLTLKLDNTPPTTSIGPVGGPYTIATVFNLTATDSGCGANITWYRIDGGNWTKYNGTFTLPEGTRNISYRSNDMLNNTEREKWLVVTVEGMTTTPEAAANYKPIVALVFVIILLVAGVWSSRKRPWKGEKERMAAVKAFMVTSMPFLLAEAATGVVSLFTGQLSIPPTLGAGTAVDLGILLFGLTIAFARTAHVKSPEVDGADLQMAK